MQRPDQRKTVVAAAKETFVKADEEKIEKGKLFDEKDYSGKIKSIYDKELGEIRYGELTLGEMAGIGDLKDVSMVEKAFIIAWKMRRKAKPDLKLEDIKDVQSYEGTKLINLLNKAQRFLPSPLVPTKTKNSLTGSKTTRTPKPSA